MLIGVSTGLLASLAMGGLVSPTGGRARLPGAYAVLCGLAWWLTVFSLACLVSQRPYFSVGFVLVLHGILLAINHAKFTAMKEPFILQDFEYFTDALRHPQFYVPFFGLIKTLSLITAGAIAIGLFMWLEPPLSGFIEAWWLWPLGSLVLGVVAAFGAWRIRPRLSLDPVTDMQALGLIALLHSHLAEYWLGRKQSLPEPARQWPRFETSKPLPNLVMVQSESFFDPRQSYGFIEPSVLKFWDTCKANAADSGTLDVPAWGANTVRTETAILTGLSQNALGIFRYNPYRRLAKTPVASLASHLRAQGYRTVCVHPYPAQFYLRDKVMPALGFDEFIDIAHFSEADHCGQYVGDQAVADKVVELLASEAEPLFVFVITMENHGPLHLEQPDQALCETVYRDAPQGPLHDLTVYLLHLRNADQTLAKLASALKATDRDGSLCWYGDHVPIMPAVYGHYGEPAASTPWLIWSSGAVPAREVQSRPGGQSLAAESLSEHWLKTVKACCRA